MTHRHDIRALVRRGPFTLQVEDTALYLIDKNGQKVANVTANGLFDMDGNCFVDQHGGLYLAD